MVCHFSNAEVRKHLQLGVSKLYAVVRKMLGLPVKVMSFGDIALWDTNIIRFFRERDDVELHVLSAHSGLKRRIASFEDQGVHYSFIRCETANLLKHMIPSDAIWRMMNPMKRDVHRLVRQIRPDIVLLVGTENAYYSSTVLGIEAYPVYTLCQTIYNNPERAAYSRISSKNATTEQELFKHFRYFGVYCKKHYDLLKGLAPESIVFKFGFPSDGAILEPVSTVKEYDFVNFALTMDMRKGFPDAIRALAIVKQKHPEVRLNLVGGSTSELRATLQALIEELGLQDNVVFTPFFEKQDDLFRHIQKSRFAVLPCKMDNVSGTMMQSMQLGLPLVVYKTTGTPTLNRDKECVLIAEHGNEADLADKMLELMDNPAKADTLRKNARQLQEGIVENAKRNGDRLLANVKAVVAHFKGGTPIPEEQLFNPERDD